MTDTPRELPRIPRADDDHADGPVDARRQLIESAAGRALPHLRGRPVSADEARGKVENFVGFAQIPVGIAGPLRVDTSDGVREVYVPMATTEGAMVASYSRGMRLLSHAGPIRARVLHEGLTQNPVFVYETAEQAARAASRCAEWTPRFEDLVASITSHGKLRSVRPEVVGRRLILRFEFTTADAIGINMAALATERCSEIVAEQTQPAHHFVHGQDVEKRANARALIEGRGRSVVAEGVVPREVLRDRARTTPEALVEILDTYRVGFAQLGTQNWLVQAANGLAAVFLACGQDLAYVTESATGQLDFHVDPNGDLHATAQLPSMLVGTVGGGSQQGTARECLDLLGCSGDGAARRFTEVLAATVLAGDVSLMAAFCSHEFVDAHERLGRNRPGKS